MDSTADDAAAVATAPTATKLTTTTDPSLETQRETTSSLRTTTASDLEVNTKVSSFKDKNAVNGEEGEMEVEEDIESPIKDFSYEEPPTPG